MPGASLPRPLREGVPQRGGGASRSFLYGFLNFSNRYRRTSSRKKPKGSIQDHEQQLLTSIDRALMHGPGCPVTIHRPLVDQDTRQDSDVSLPSTSPDPQTTPHEVPPFFLPLLPFLGSFQEREGGGPGSHQVMASQPVRE